MTLVPYCGSYWKLDGLVGRYLLAVQEGGPSSTEATEVFQHMAEAWADIQEARCYFDDRLRTLGRAPIAVLRNEARPLAEVADAAEGA